MYFWKVEQLIEDLKEDKVNSNEQFRYILLLFLLAVIASDPLLVQDVVLHDLSVYESIGMIVLTVWGINHTYKVNVSGDDKDFMVRFICLGLPVAIRLFAVVVPLVIVIIISGIYLEVSTALIELLFVLVSQVVFYLNLGKAIKKVSA